MLFNPWKKKEKDIITHKNKMNITESCLDRHALSDPDKLALFFQNKNKIKKYTYKELNEQVNKFSNYLESLNVKPDSRVFIFLQKCPEMYISFLGVIKQGSIAIPLFEAFQQEGLMLRLDRGDAEVLITNRELSKRIPRNIKSRISSLKHIVLVDSQGYKKGIKKQSSEFATVLKDRKESAMMIFTSSTAGTPVAGVEIAHQALIQQHFTGKFVLKLEKNSNYWCTAHPGWVTGSVYGIISPLSLGSSVFVLEDHFDAKKWIDFIKKNKITNIYTAPTALRLLKSVIKKSDLESVKEICSVGEALTEATFDFYSTLGIKIIDSYWQTETGAIVIANTDKKHGSMGRAIPGIKAKIKKGTITLKPNFPSLMTGIYKHQQMYKDYFAGGWFKTNDNAEKRGGYFYFIGRGDDIIKTSGERVSPIEIESILMKHKAVKEAAVIGIPDKIKGSVLKAFIILNDKTKPSEDLKEQLSLFVKENYAGHSYPKEVEFVSCLPKTNSGKIIRMKLREIEKCNSKK